MAVTNTATTGENVQVATGAPDATTGHAGLATQLPGQATTISGYDLATRGQDVANLIENDVDREIFRIKSEDTPLMQMLLLTKPVSVDSAEVEHYAIDEPRSILTTEEVTTGGKTVAVLKLEERDKNIPHEYTMLLVQGVDGYDEKGEHKTPGKPLQLFVTGKDAMTECPIVRAVNGPVSESNSQLRKMVDIPAGTKIVVLANACYETQKEVEPDGMTPKGQLVYLQKTIFNQVVSEYFDKQKKHIPFGQSMIAEAQIAEYKMKRNRAYLIGRRAKWTVNTKLGPQIDRSAEGVLWQMKKRYQHQGKWTYEEFIALMKMFFTGEDVPSTCIALCGKNFLENIQTIDFSKHPEVQFTQRFNKIGWSVTAIHTVFGDVEFKREPTLDKVGMSNSALLLGNNRLVRYKFIEEKNFSDKVEGEEATRKGIINWDAPALKGSCHIWVDGENKTATTEGLTFVTYDGKEAPSTPAAGVVYYLMEDCPGISAGAVNGTMWQYKDEKWTEYTGAVFAN